MKQYYSKTLNKKVTIIGEYCAHCDSHEISEDPEIAAEELCDRCFKEIHDQDDLKWAWRKGE